MDAETECYWMTDQLRVILESIPEQEWTPRLSEAAELRQDFHDWTCRWETQQEKEERPEWRGRAPLPQPHVFRRQMENCGFVFDVPGKSVEYRPSMAKGTK